MLEYIIEVSLCWSVFYLFFFFVLRKMTFFRVNRFYLLLSLIFGLLLPILKTLSFGPAIPPLHHVLESAPLSSITSNIPVQMQTLSDRSSGAGLTSEVIWLIYLAGAFIFFLRLLYGLYKIRKMWSQGVKTHRDEYTLIETNQYHLPFSFFSWVFLSTKVPLREELDNIIRHELAHVKAFHTVDVVFLECIQVIFWFNPFVYLFKMSLRQNHEFFADKTVLSTTTIKDYGIALLRQSVSGIQLSLTHQFFQTHLKDRIRMMYKKKSNKSSLGLYILILPFLVLMMIIFSGHSVQPLSTNQKSAITYPDSIIVRTESATLIEGRDYIINPDNGHLTIINETYLKKGEPIIVEFIDPGDSQVHPRKRIDTLPNPPQAEEIFKVVEEMPLFPGTTDKLDSDQKLVQYIQTNIRYPKDAIREEIEGKVFAKFIVNTDSSISDIAIVRGIGGGCDEEAIRVLQSIEGLPNGWTPGRQRGKNVRVIMTIPIVFTLSENSDLVEPIGLIMDTVSTQDPKTLEKIVKIIERPKFSEEALKKFYGLNYTNPIYIVDGRLARPGPMIDSLDPDDVQSIEVVKDQKANLLYGKYGDNGIVFITTKSQKEK